MSPAHDIGQHLGENREERRLGLPSCGRCQDDEVRPVEVGVDGETLDGPQIRHAKRIDDVVLKGRMQVGRMHSQVKLDVIHAGRLSFSLGGGHLAGVQGQLVVLARVEVRRTDRSGPARRRRAS